MVLGSNPNTLTLINLIIKFYNQTNLTLFVKLYIKYFYKLNVEVGFYSLYCLLSKVFNVTYYKKLKILYLSFIIYKNLLKLLNKKIRKKLKKKILKKSLKVLTKDLIYLYNYLLFFYNKNYFLGEFVIRFKKRNIFINILLNNSLLKVYSSGILGFMGKEKITVIACRDLSKISGNYA